MKFAVVPVLCLLLLCGAGWGGEHPLDVEIQECMDKDPSTHGTIKCAREGAKKWDTELNRAYKELMGLLPKQGQDALRTAQRAWIPWRDREFGLVGSVYGAIYNSLDGGTMWLVVNAIAEMEVVRGRTLELIAWSEEMKKGKPVFEGAYPEKQTDDQLAAAMRVKNASLRLGKRIGKEGENTAAANLAAWEEFRNRNVLF
ncbi:MAG TPA: lysozyme inhibitor LprI family protein, partial [Synergistales bacterium]|nr:lysozyme inhibitor LprI family protein [Synergistales bacterium]